MSSFVERLPGLLRELAEPVTSYTAKELWCRIYSEGWDACVATLKNELDGDDSNVKCLVLSIICEQAEQVGQEYAEPFHGIIERLLNDNHARTRMAAILAVRQLLIMTSSVKNALREISCSDEAHLCAEAIVTLVELDPKVASEISGLLRASPSWRTGGIGLGCHD